SSSALRCSVSALTSGVAVAAEGADRQSGMRREASARVLATTSCWASIRSTMLASWSIRDSSSGQTSSFSPVWWRCMARWYAMRAGILVLGPLEAEVEGTRADLGGPLQRAVLALLLMERGRVVSVDRMIDQLWRGEPPPRAIASLQAYVSNLRRIRTRARAAG